MGWSKWERETLVLCITLDEADSDMVIKMKFGVQPLPKAKSLKGKVT